jgi:hypothetical protein
MPMDADSSDSNVISIPAFVQGVIELARNQDNADTMLLNILEKHILTQSPANGAVQTAIKEIQALAEERAQFSPKNNEAQKNAGSDKD